MVGDGKILPPLAHAEAPAGGAPTEDLIAAIIVGALLTAIALAIGVGQRTGRVRLLDRAAAGATRLTGLPGWSALPVLLAGASLLTAAFGFFWDVATHIDDGRDAGPFANDSHFLILAGLGGIALAGYAGVVLGTPRRERDTVALAPGWHVPIGALLILVCGVVALAGFPLDDVWHRLFGQDVTLWGPTHLMMIGGAALSTLGVWVLLVEGRREARPRTRFQRRVLGLREMIAAGAFLIGLSALQLEFGFGVPQFNLLFHPAMIALAAGIGLVAARVRLGRGGALVAVVSYLPVMAILALIVGPGFGHSQLHFPLYLAEAVLVELVALAVDPRRPVGLGALSGLAIGTVGVAAEWGWSHVWMPIPWTGSLLPELALLGPLAGISGGVLGGFIGRALRGDGALTERAPGWIGALALLVAIGCLAYPLPKSEGEPVTATVTLAEAGGDRREVVPTVRLDPPDAAEDARWFNVLAWQGGGSRLEPLEEVAAGTYRTSHPVPVHGDWKALIRLHDGRSIEAVPIYLPHDEAIPAEEVPATRRFERGFAPDSEFIRREARGGSAWLKVPAYGTVALLAALWIGALAWGIRRIDPTIPPRPGRPSWIGRAARPGPARSA